MRKSDDVDVDLREDCEEDLADVGHNADLYVVNQSVKRIWGTFRFHSNGNGLSQELFYFQSLRLD